MRASVGTTVLLTVTVVLVSLLLGLGLALLLDRGFRGRGIVRTLLITPFLIVPVASALLWKHALYNASYGLLNGSLTWIWRLFGSDSPPQPDWMTDSPLAAVEVSLIWQWTPFMMLILLAGLQSRASDAVEAARMDGASAFDIFRYLTLPHLRRYLELAALLGTVYVVQNFDAVFTITSGGLGTPTFRTPSTRPSTSPMTTDGHPRRAWSWCCARCWWRPLRCAPSRPCCARR